MEKPNSKLAATFWTAVGGLIIFTLLWTGLAVFQTRIPQSGKPAELYSTEARDDLQLTFSSAISGANKSVLLFIYSLKDKRILNSLRKQAESGTDVTIICDAAASRGVHKKLGPKVKVFLRKGKGLMHQKILVVDRRKVWIGSANMTTSSLKMYGNLVAGFDSESLAERIRQKADAMVSVGLVEYIPEKEFSIGGQRVEMWFLPDSRQGVEKIRKMIQGARKSIRVAMFTWTRTDFAADLAAANRRGVTVETVIDRNSARSSSSKVTKNLLQSGVAVRHNTGAGLLHHKFMVIDDQILVNGSANWTASAFNKNDDCFIVIHDLNQKQKKHLDKTWKTILQNSEWTNSPVYPHH